MPAHRWFTEPASAWRHTGSEYVVRDPWGNSFHASPNFNPTLLQDQLVGKVVASTYGCWCPPHRGHFEAVYEMCRRTKADYMILTTINDDTYPRHGIPVLETIRAWIDWGKIIRRDLGTEVMITTNDMQFTFVPPTVKEFWSCTAAENEEQAAKLRAEGRTNPDYPRFVHNNQWHQLVIVRKDDGLSATKFVQCLKDPYRQDCSGFIPKLVSLVEGRQYIQRLSDLYGTELK